MRIILSAAVLMAAVPAGAQDVLATVNGESLTWEELLDIMGGAEYAQYLDLSSEAEAEDMLRSWVREELVVQAAEASGLSSRPDVASVIDQAVRQILLEAYLSDLTSDIEVSRLTVENYVAAWYDSYRLEIHARHILVPDLASAQAVLARLRAGESFEAVATEISTCPSSQQGGDLGWLRRGEAVLPFEEAAYSLAPGAMSEIVQTSMGFHIIKLLETRPISPAPTDDQIFQLAGQELMQDASETAILEAIDSLAASSSVVVYPERLLQRAGQ